MDEYISRRELLARYDAEHEGAPGRARELIKQAPAADVAPVRHGRWIVFDSENPESKECTACGYLFSRIHPSNYCPYCGALMDGKED